MQGDFRGGALGIPLFDLFIRLNGCAHVGLLTHHVNFAFVHYKEPIYTPLYKSAIMYFSYNSSKKTHLLHKRPHNLHDLKASYLGIGPPPITLFFTYRNFPQLYNTIEPYALLIGNVLNVILNCFVSSSLSRGRSTR